METIAVAFIGAVGLISAAWVGNKKLENLKHGQHEIHVLVNSRLSEALGEIQRLRDWIEEEKGMDQPPDQPGRPLN